MSRQKETLQERLQARIDKHRDPRGNICLGTYNHWDSALDLEAIGSLDAAQAEIARLTKDLQRAEARDSGGHAPDGVTWKHAWMREAEWRGRAVDAANMLIDLCAHADFRNGNTDESQSCDEGERLAAGIIEQAKALLPEQAPLRQPEGWQPTRDQLRPFAARAASHFMDLSGDCPAATIVEGVLDTMLNDWASASQVSPQEAAKAVGAFGDWQFISEARSNPAKTPTPASAAKLDAETIQTLLDLLNPLHGSLDEQTYDEKVKEGFDAPHDAEYSVNVTARQERDLTQAVLILEDRKRAAASTPAPASAQDDLVKALAFLFDARLKATERLQQFLDTFGDLGDRNTDAEMSDWLGYKSPASTDFTDLEKFIRKQLSATGGAK